MIQRIQTLYLLIVTGLLIATACLPVAYFTDAVGAYPFSVLGVDVNGAHYSTSGLFFILLLSTTVSLATIFLFKNRPLQVRMSVFNSLLLVGFYIAFVTFYFSLRSEVVSFRVDWALSFPLIAIILNYLAIRAISKDELMVKAADRLR
ncbi:DUF4293 domain-containing protein [Bacteroides reticulotermitis]|uniref:DUF4293 family protein n=2 Tax=Bacteroides reticulotermitis TaxID=1133319 RepID=W4ULZ6_9BACE|nr:DUF4293 domain-containing protein [Bacteroides reticulotermitis]MBB4043320.1 putative membrane protein YczE [Bacteroides reticulotermitis]GAE81956.1 hypothetical protein JCM10512_124 [Bacteroides reticulotermitis JCM 10512]HJD75142.1 DUF4293 domain-containing protein [Bacteroides reticulotermitis]